jgi:hypothetical protein
MVSRYRTVMSRSPASTTYAGSRKEAIGTSGLAKAPSPTAMPVSAPTMLFVTDRTSKRVPEPVPAK